MYHYRNAIRSKFGTEGVILIRENNNFYYEVEINISIKGGY